MSDPDEIAHDYAPAFIAAQEARQCRKCDNRENHSGWCKAKDRWVPCDGTCEDFSDD